MKRGKNKNLVEKEKNPPTENASQEKLLKKKAVTSQTTIDSVYKKPLREETCQAIASFSTIMLYPSMWLGLMNSRTCLN
jgi:hypothetical protein